MHLPPLLPFIPLILMLPRPTLCTPTPSTSQEYTSATTFQSTLLSITNTYRRQHNASSLTWNDTLASYAEQHVESCKFEHSGGEWGENLASGYANVTSAVVGWGEERRGYEYKGEFSETTGHFTQLVWKSTATLGCARKDCDAQGDAPGWYVVCEYAPAGNVIGAFEQNVQRPVKKELRPQGPSDPAVPEPEGVEGLAVGRRVGVGVVLGALVVGCLGGEVW